MGKKILLVALIWLGVAVVVFVLYLLREVSPVKEFIAWVLTMWPILLVIGAFAVAASGYIIKHKFNPIKQRQQPATGDKVKPPLGVVINKVKLDDSPKPGWVVFSVSMTLEPSEPIQLGKLDLDYSPELAIYPLQPAMKGPYPPMGGLPTKLVERIESYEVKYEVPGKYNTLLIEQGLREQALNHKGHQPQACIHVMAGELDFNTEPFPVPTPRRQLNPDTGGSLT